jgi:hypothetical protein
MVRDMRSGLGEQLDQELFKLVPPILEPAGFKTARSKRAWRRTDDVCEQIVVVEVDGRSAREGFLEAFVSVGINIPWEKPNSHGPLLAGRPFKHQPDFLVPPASMSREAGGVPMLRSTGGESPNTSRK